MPRTRNVKISFWVTEDQHKLLSGLAKTRHLSLSDYVRRTLEDGASVDGCKNDIDFIRRHIREELSNIINPKIERIVKLVVKSGIVSAAGYFLNAEMLAEFIPVSRQRELQDVLLESKKKGVVYFRLTDQELEEFAANENRIINKYVGGGG